LNISLTSASRSPKHSLSFKILNWKYIYIYRV
jgi:hypothetical protein